MEILLLGTGSADGWPNPFCRCASCTSSATQVRGQTAALVDDVLLLDCGPEAPRAAMRLRRSLAHVRHILFTHGHPDHVGPAALLMRHWTGAVEPLDVVGPPSALEQCRHWVGPDDPIRFVTVQAGDRIRLGDYDVRVLAAAHGADIGGDAVLYDMESVGARIFWATDTGPLPEETHAAVAGAGYDAVFLEETFGTYTDHGTEHHDLPAFAATVARLRDCGAVTDTTDVVAVHLSHHNPSEPELTAVLSDSGARPGRDGEVVRVGATDGGATRTLVLGGARSGKSAHAEALLAREPAVTYLATGGVREGDPEWAERVRLHRARRPDSWRTVETTDVAEELRSAPHALLLDCLGTWLTARMDLHHVWDGDDGLDDGVLDPVHADIDELVAAWRDCPAPVVAVSNEVGSGVVPPTASGRLFRDLLGVLNARIAAASDEVVLMVAGRPLRLPAD
ncbi:bifunctional adenosylcobinamide kinase/adenosylcobinamide-phosphate guanylyltransferase [Mycolicibacter virginiensis]|uniref:bifunctional adenosylcobinamide kinase/adenosylcobinamide-phosphate guanylyltransferase n=1 Tax=Mycolicibacter virginiensis TaxID=1795032 RepID=UPI001F047853|nr:bifunctional adenosylcobinamide kinase/adenosylcobinamide-phosphate guanylyltransferase [Mycolicibacter virginiensis]ULP48073.1 bifunctional adenosylcobinamide kinase/adenosylcobinamide-phosphate guanylyltransferase [Mycolicibacter virginiensis]